MDNVGMEGLGYVWAAYTATFIVLAGYTALLWRRLSQAKPVTRKKEGT